LYHSLYIARFAWSGTDEYGKNPRITIGHIYVSGKILRPGYSAAFSMNTPVKSCFGA
jgi:hypothetical protein